MSTTNVQRDSNVLMDMSNAIKPALDERVQIVGKILQSVGISAVVWGADALLHHAISTLKTRNDFLLPNEDFLRAAEALRLHSFTALDPLPGSPHYIEGLEHYGAQYAFPAEVTERLGSEITVALFPASLVSWKLVYVPVRDIYDMGSFTTSLAVQKIQIPLSEEVDHSFIQLSRSSSASDLQDIARDETTEGNVKDTISLASNDSDATVDGNDDTDEDGEYILIPPTSPRTFIRRGSVPMQRGNGPKSPDESLCEIVNPRLKPSKSSGLDMTSGNVRTSTKETISLPPADFIVKEDSACDISEMKPEKDAGAVEMLPGQKMLEKPEGTLTRIAPGIWAPHTEGLRDSFLAAGEFMRRDGMGVSGFGRGLQGWGSLWGGKKEDGRRRCVENE